MKILNILIRFIPAIIIAGFLSGIFAATAYPEELPDDSTNAFAWSSVYSNSIKLERISLPFPWNDPEVTAYTRDRLSAEILYRPFPVSRVFLKGATGRRKVEEGIYRNRLQLEQGDLVFGVPRFTGGIIIFMRERRLETGNRLLKIVSNDSPLDSGGEGIAANLGGDGFLSAGYTGVVFRDRLGDERYGGLPAFEGGGGSFNLLRCELRRAMGWHLGMAVSETRSQVYGDASMICVDMGAAFGGMTFLAELAGSRSGRLREIADRRLFDIYPRKIKPASISSAFGDDAAFSAELLGLEVKSDKAGSFGLVPGYDFQGEGFSDPQGELSGKLIESRLTAWWRHPSLAAMLTLDASERCGKDSPAGTGLLKALMRMRFKGGVEMEEGLLLGEGSQPSILVSLLDENSRTLLSATARLDGTGKTNELYFLADGAMILGKGWAAKTALFLQGSGLSLYNAELEFRPGPRFLFRGSFGSFAPCDESIILEQELHPRSLNKERFISIYTRISLGDF